MSSRISSLTTSPDHSLDRMRQAVSEFSLPDLGALIWSEKHTPRANISRLLTMPWWIGADVPGALPHPRARVATPTDTVEERLIRLLTIVRRRQLVFRLGTLFFRSLALTMVIGILWVLVATVVHTVVNASVLTLIGIILAAFGIAWGWWSRPGLRETAAMLDHSFALDDRMRTAVDSIGTRQFGLGDDLAIPDLQLIEAINTLAILNRRRELGLQAPWREMVRCVGFGLLFLGVYLL
ncbi:MAG TPA: hypothetical protein PK819_01980, partial [Thermomicrobiales bacterium]|nr:hypothetical protein [Thermomicrobiales bacterium]